MTPLDDLLAACNDLAADTHYATKTRTLARRIAAWAPTVTPAPTPTPPATPVPVGALMFSEDFAAPLNPAKWDIKTHDRWLAANVTVHDGILDIQATRDTVTGVWHGGEIQGLAPAYQYVGPRYMECRAKLPVGAGTWPAPLWEWNAPWGGLGIENDVNELLGKDPTRYYVHVHNGPNESFGKPVVLPFDPSSAFHTYGCAMYSDHAAYYCDGKLMETITFVESGLSAWPFTVVPMVVVIDLDMGGTWAGPVTVSLPVHMLVDYVNVWRLPV